ncbi:unnamed protein product [Caretta caretta]
MTKGMTEKLLGVRFLAEMRRGCCLLLLLSNLCGIVRSDVVLEQGAQALAVREGEEVTFQCRVKGGEMNSYWMNWYRKGQRGPLTWIYREGDHYGEGFQGRFVGEVDSSNNRFTLKILSAELRDRAVYYCASSPHGATAVLRSRAKTDRAGGGRSIACKLQTMASSEAGVAGGSIDRGVCVCVCVCVCV